MFSKNFHTVKMGFPANCQYLSLKFGQPRNATCLGVCGSSAALVHGHVDRDPRGTHRRAADD